MASSGLRLVTLPHVTTRCDDVSLNAISQVSRCGGNANRPLHELMPLTPSEERCAGTEHDGCEVDPKLVGQAVVDAPAHDAAAAHDEDVLVSCSGA